MAATYRILSIVPVNRWVRELQEAVPSHEIRVQWASTGDVLTVYVPDATYNPTEVDSAIRQAGYNNEQVRSLGGSSS